MGIRTYQGSVTIITGGASGLGKALGLEIARLGGAEIVVSDIQREMAEETAEQIRRLGARATVEIVDVRDAEAVERMVAAAHERAGRIDYVFNNAGLGVMGEAHLLEARDWQLTLDVNVYGVVNVIRAAYPRLVDQGFGHLVNTASLAGLMGTPFLSAYCAAKHAVVGLSKAMRVEAAHHGVRVTALCPGVVKTPILTSGAFGRTIYEITDARLLQWWKQFKPGDVDVFAKECLDEVARNKPIIVLPKHNRATATLFRMFPALEEKIASKLYASTLARFPEMRPPKRAKATTGAAEAAAPTA
ncbi:MAG: SDR family oxidoreductase [Labilithrix sp.]|nr:SDR family oxidoreductase [Labilithrix sp.]